MIGHSLMATRKIIENVGYFRLDVGHMLMFGVIAVTFNRRD